MARLRAAGPWRVAAMGATLVFLLAAPAWAWEEFRFAIGRDLAFDWRNLVEAGARVGSGSLYDFSGAYVFRWSPLAAVGFAALAPIGLVAWRVLHLVALPALGNWRLAAISLLSFGFWFDVDTGNLMIFVLLASVWAVRGSRIGTWAFLALFLLAPRPLLLPVAAWLLWQRPGLRVPFVLLAAGQLLLVAAMGYLPGWIGALTDPTAAELTNIYNLGPSRVLGAAWIPIGLVLAALLTWRGHLGLACLAASPYLLPYYLLMGLLEWVRVADQPDRQRRSQTTAVASA